MQKQTFSKLFVAMCAISVTFLLVSNIVAIKTIAVFGFIFAAADVIFPLTYILGDVFTEVYGYKTARFVILLSFFCNLIMVILFALAIAIPGSESFTEQEAMATILGNTPRLLAASFIAYVIGNLVNAKVMSVLKVKTKGKYLALRTITSTIAGEGLDTLIFVPVAFLGILELPEVINMVITVFLMKVIFEIILTPITYRVIAIIKKKENIDTYDDIEKKPVKSNA